MREKSVLKFNAKIRSLTVRKRNLDAEVIKRLNQVIRGTANYFGPRFSTNRTLFDQCDKWIRMRLRCMKKKRKSYREKWKLRLTYFRNKLELVEMLDLIVCDWHTA